jgi:site-specific DNA-methyltransferase (adenine-specific)
MTTEEATLRIDPEFSSLIPPLTPEELAQLEANIVAEGCRDPLVVWGPEGILLDGHNRLRICRKLGVQFDVKEVFLADRDAAKLWIEENQLGRRNLTDDQRAAIAFRIQQRRSELAKKQRAQRANDAKYGRASLSDTSSDKDRGKTDTRAAVAREARVPERKVRAVAEVAKAAPQLVDQIAAGKVTLKQATKAARRQEKEQRKAALPVPGAPGSPATDRYIVHQGELTHVGGDVAAGSVDWIITDPPYGREHLGLYGELSEFAFRVLKPGGSALCMTGQSFLPEVLAQLGKHLTYHWTLAYLTLGGQSAQLWGRKVNTFWKPVLWYVKGRYEGDWAGDVCKSAINDKQHHHWGQSESGTTDIIERFTYPGQTICDPFCGGGTVGVVAVRMNRLFVGIDSDAEAVATTLKRLTEAAGA